MSGNTSEILESKDDLSSNQINTLTQAVGWGKRADEKWDKVIQASSHVAYVRDIDGNLIAFGRILEDGVMCMFYDICVHPKWRYKGLGTAIMHHLTDKVKGGNYVSIGLFVWDKNKTSADFYAKFGFEKVATGMELAKYMKTEG